MPSVIHLLQTADSLLTARGVDSPRLSAQLLLAHVLGMSRMELLISRELLVSPVHVDLFDHLLRRRLAGEPVAYLLGTKEFFGLDFSVDASVLVPRPETEEMVEHLQTLFPSDTPLRFADIGTGSGVLAVTIASLFSKSCGLAVDIQPLSLAVARRNMYAHAVASRLSCVNGDFLSSFKPHSLDLIVTNPPYITEAEYAHLSHEVASFEPRIALVAGPDGLECLRAIEADARSVLRPGGVFLAEIGWQQGAKAKELFAHWFSCRILKDLSGKDRIVSAVR